MLTVSTCKAQPTVWSPRRAMTLVLGLATGATVATCLWGARQEYVRPMDIGQGRTQNADVCTYVYYLINAHMLIASCLMHST